MEFSLINGAKLPSVFDNWVCTSDQVKRGSLFEERDFAIEFYGTRIRVGMSWHSVVYFIVSVEHQFHARRTRRNRMEAYHPEDL